MQQWLPGHQLKNRPYQIERELGQGGFGITYKALDLTLDIPVVIKTPNSKLQRDGNYEKYVANFTREAKQLAQLGLNPHPHIVRVISLFKEDKLPCIVMDFIPGQSLYDLVRTQGKLSETKAVEYIRQIGSALSVCHSAGIVHRDVHPNNILIHADNGKAILIDFGISGTTQTSRNTHSGNRAFAPWEQMAYWEGENSKTPQVDIYTLAASLYFLVTGQEPTECLARKYNDRELIEPKQLNPELSDTLNQAILKGVEVLPGDRPNSMWEWLQLLFIPSATPPIKRQNNSRHQTVDKTSEIKHKVTNKNIQPIKRTHVNPALKQDSTLINNKVIDVVGHDNQLSVSKSERNFTSYNHAVVGVFLALLSIISIFAGIRENYSSDVDLPETTEESKQKAIKPELIATLTGHSSAVGSIAFSPDGQTLASGNYDKTIKLWNVSTKQEVATLTGHIQSVESVAFSPDGQTLASGSGDNTIKLWNVSTKQEIATLTGHSDGINSVAFSPDGQTLASGSRDNTIKLWNVSTEQEIATLAGHSGDINSVAFSPDERTLASGSGDNTIKLWNVSTKQEIATLAGHLGGINSIAFSPDGQTLASNSDRTIVLWNNQGEEIATLAGHLSKVRSVIFSSDSKVLASVSVGGTIKFWNVSTNREIATLTDHSDTVKSVAFSPDDQTLASGSDDGTIKLWKIPPDLE